MKCFNLIFYCNILYNESLYGSDVEVNLLSRGGGAASSRYPPNAKVKTYHMNYQAEPKNQIQGQGINLNDDESRIKFGNTS